MKIIHCADIHLDSTMTTNFDSGRAAQRRHEVLITFIRMNEYAAANKVEMILIAGDLFDTEFASENTKQQVMSTIVHNRDIQYVYIEGNHDEGTFIRNMVNRPENLHCLNSGEEYDYGNITVMAADRPEQVSLKEDRSNIVIMHGEPDIRAFAGKNIDYFALGHLHSFQTKVIDSRGTACYSGCLEGRGFDETGDKGFVLLDVQQRITYKFISFASRKVVECKTDIEGCESSKDVQDCIDNALQQSGVLAKDIVRIKLTGRVTPELQISKRFLESLFAEMYFAFYIDDEGIRPAMNTDLYKNDISLKGSFIRKVMSSDEPETVKREIIELGMTVLLGEEPESCIL